MRSIPLTFCGAAVVAATLLSAPVALADSDSGSDSGRDQDSASRATLSVDPSSVAPGGEVDLQFDGCKSDEAKGISDAFESDASFSPEGSDGLFAEAKVRSDASAGDYDIWVTCNDDKSTRASGTVTVVDRDGTAPLTPIAPVAAGGGGTATVLAGETAEQSGPGTVHTVIGLVLAAVAAVAVALRSARRRRPVTD
ncbi:hypothetical protein LRD69_10855 [Streptomyces sp. JH14]|uniref:hypothetical protein n=1 Tax=Streptomyces sp. JH14 TaxID=2793630 RepID=UPI0023F8B01C|nr:hypothetical protein [Streptomyces sp. JH14]MDF6042649.1 hypothetical protein [Streptomyces sp. JH14]